MWRTAVIAVAAFLAASAVLAGSMHVIAERAAISAEQAERVGTQVTRLRLCVGPARVTLGSQPLVGLAFGGEGCGGASADLVGVRIVRSEIGPVEARASEAVRERGRVSPSRAAPLGSRGGFGFFTPVR